MYKHFLIYFHIVSKSYCPIHISLQFDIDTQLVISMMPFTYAVPFLCAVSTEAALYVIGKERIACLAGF